MIRVISKTLSVALLIVLIFVLVLLTPLGLQISMQVAGWVLPGKLTYDKLSGVIIGPISITNLHYHYQKSDYRIADLHIQWSPSELAFGHISFTNFLAKGVRITIPITTTPNPKKAETESKPKLPLHLDVEYAHIEDIRIGYQPNKYPVKFQSISVAGLLEPGDIHVHVNTHLVKPYNLKFNFFLDGSLAHYIFSLSAKSRHINWSVKGKGSPYNVNFRTHDGRTLSGMLSGQFQFWWDPIFKWQVNFDSSKLNLSEVHKDWPKTFNLKLKTKGSLATDDPNFEFVGTVGFPGAQAHITGSRKGGATWQVKWQAKITDFKKIAPSYRGSLASNGELNGVLNKAVLYGDLDGKGLVFPGNNRIGKIGGKWRLDLSDQTASSIDWTAQDTAIQGLNFKNLKLKADGKLEDHNFDIFMQSRYTHTDLKFHGGYNKGRWRGQLNQFNVKSERYGPWHLDKASPLLLSLIDISVQPICITSNRGGSLCIEGNWKKGQPWVIKAHSDKVNNSILSYLLPPNLELRGSMILDAKAVGEGQKIKNAKFNLQFTPGSINFVYKKRSIKTPYRGGYLNATADHNGAKAKLLFQLNNRNQIRANISLPQYPSKGLFSRKHKIKGDLFVQILDLPAFAALITDEAIPEGRVDANLTVGGAFDAPNINGRLKLTNGKITIPTYGVTMKNVYVDVKSIGSKFNYLVSAKSGGQALTAKGSTDLLADGLPTELSLTGDRVLIINTPQYQIYASPNLHLKSKDKKLNITGSLTIPAAQIKPHTFKNAVSLPHSDIEFIGDRDKLYQRTWNISSDTSVILGDNVMLDTSGLTGRVAGQLKIFNKNNQPLFGTGRISLHDAKFSAYSINLTIQNGSGIYYHNNLLSNPNLDLVAYREIKINNPNSIMAYDTDKILAGIKITGTFHNPQILLYSEPAILSQADTMSYLLTGSAGGIPIGSIPDILNAISDVPIGKSTLGNAGLVSHVKGALGLSEFGFESDTALAPSGTPIARSSSFVIGKYLTQNLYLRYSLRYAIGSTSAIPIIQVRYYLSKNWAIQSETSTSDDGVDGIDILYTIEKNGHSETKKEDNKRHVTTGKKRNATHRSSHSQRRRSSQSTAKPRSQPKHLPRPRSCNSSALCRSE